MSELEKRKEDKERHKKYREVARKKGYSVSNHTMVHETADKDGAFIEVSIYISREEIND